MTDAELDAIAARRGPSVVIRDDAALARALGITGEELAARFRRQGEPKQADADPIGRPTTLEAP